MGDLNIKYILGIDFETANSSRASPCSMGLYLKDIINNNVIMEKEILINPNDYFDEFNILIHGITPERVENEPDFTYAYQFLCDTIKKYESIVVIAHNASFDMSVLRKTCDQYSLQYPQFIYLCSMVISKTNIFPLLSYSLPNIVEYLNLGEFEHHNASEDSKMSVKILEHFIKVNDWVSMSDIEKSSGIHRGILKSDDYIPCGKEKNNVRATNNIDISQYVLKETNPFENANVVFTGKLDSMQRNQAVAIIESLGGRVLNTVSHKVNFLICGYQDKYKLNGKEKSTKMIKAEELLEQGCNIELIDEVEFLHCSIKTMDMIEIVNETFMRMSETKDFPELHTINELKNGYSYFCYNIKGFSYGSNKTNEYIEFVTSDLNDFNLSDFTYETKNTSTRLYLCPDINQEKLYDLFSYINDKCDNIVPVDFECCSRFKECSEAKRCINKEISDGVPLGLNCGYRKILNKGKVFY